MTKTIGTRLRRGAKMAAGVAASALMAACAQTAGPSGLYKEPIGNAPVTSNPTPYTGALVCMGSYARAEGVASPTIAVGRIVDYTGKVELEGGAKVTQGAALMAMSAFAKAGVRLVERYDTSVSELELKYANNKLITDDLGEGFRKIHAGQVPGSDFYMVGGITELNYNIHSSGIEAFGGDVDATDPKGSFGRRVFVMNVGLDLRLVDTQSLEIVDVISYQKQIIGREISAGVFSFFNNNILDIGAGGKALEPIQLAVRSVVERAVLEMTANLYGVYGPQVCQYADPLSTQGATGDYYVAYESSLEQNNGTTRENPNRWHEDRDPVVDGYLRGTYR